MMIKTKKQDLTVILTQRDVEVKLTSGRVLKLSIGQRKIAGEMQPRYVMSGGACGEHHLATEADITDAARLAAHWQGYIEVNCGKDGASVVVDEPERKTLRGPNGITIALAASEVYPDDPGNGCPALVNLPFGKGSGTYWCVSDTGEVMKDDGEMVNLSARAMRWLNSGEVADAVNGFVEYWTRVKTGSRS